MHKKYTTAPRQIIKTSEIKLFTRIGLKKYTTPPIIAAAKKGYSVACKTLNLTYLFVRYTTNTTEQAIKAEAIATPLKPNSTIKIGVITQVAMVQKTIRYKEIFIFPMALSALVKGVEMEDNAAVIEKKAKDRIAGSHLRYLGIKWIK